MEKLKLLSIGALCLLYVQGFAAGPVLEKPAHLIVDGHDVDTFLDRTLNKAIRPFAKRMIDCAPELMRLTVDDVQEVLTSVEDTAQFVMREMLAELEGHGDCSPETNITSTDILVKEGAVTEN